MTYTTVCFRCKRTWEAETPRHGDRWATVCPQCWEDAKRAWTHPDRIRAEEEAARRELLDEIDPDEDEDYSYLDDLDIEDE